MTGVLLIAPSWPSSTAIAEELRSVSKELRQGFTILSDDSAEKSKLEADAARRRLLREKFNVLLYEACGSPGLSGFMRPKSFLSLAQVAVYRPVVVLLAAKAGCHALLLRPGQDAPTIVPLLQITEDELRKLRDLLQSANHSAREVVEARTLHIKQSKNPSGAYQVLQIIWLKVMKPVITVLQLEVSCLAFRIYMQETEFLM